MGIFKVSILILICASLASTAPVGDKLENLSCFAEQLKNSSGNQIFVCNDDGIIPDEKAAELKLLEQGFPPKSDCEARIFVSLKNSSHESNLIAETGFVCTAACCDTIAISYCAEDDHIFFTQNVSGNSIQACRIQRIIHQSNIIPEGNNTVVSTRIHDVINQLTAEFRDPKPESICADYKIDDEIVSHSVSKVPLIITIVLGVLIAILVLVFIGVCVYVCLARRGGAGGKGPAFLFRRGKGETIEAQPLGEEAEEMETKKEPVGEIVEENAKNEKIEKNESEIPLADDHNDESLVAAVYNATTTAASEQQI